MPVSTYNKVYLKKLLGFEIDDSTLEKNLENIGAVLKRVSEKEIDVEYEADRPDLMSAVGLARALRYFMHRSERFEYLAAENTDKIEINIGKNVARIRPYISALVVRNMQLSNDSLLDMINFTEKLSDNYGRHRKRIALGLHDLKDVQPPLTYDAFDDEVYVPLNSKEKMKYSEALEKLEKGGKYRNLCTDGKRYVALKDTKGTMSLIPVLNSSRTMVSTGTKEMLVDITGTSKYIVDRTADMVAAYFIDMKCDVQKVKLNYGKRSYETPSMERAEIKMPLSQICAEIGVWIKFGNAIDLANRMGYEAALVGSKIMFEVPAYRLDVLNDQDVIEDIAIAYGYERIRPVPVVAVQQGQLDRNEMRYDMLREVMIGLDFWEELNSYMTNEETDFGMMRLERKKEYIKIRNAKASTITMLRTWLLPSLLSDLGKSQHDSFPQKVFELDMAFGLRNGMPVETHRLAAVISSNDSNFNDSKSVFKTVADLLKIKAELVPAAHKSFIDGRCAEIKVKNKSVGFLGEIHPEVLGNFGIEEPVVALEIDLDEISD